MSKSKLALLTAMSMLAASVGGNILDPDYRPPQRKPKFNETKKCFREGCNNHRTGDSLYCSDECQKIYHNLLKEKENKS